MRRFIPILLGLVYLVSTLPAQRKPEDSSNNPRPFFTKEGKAPTGSTRPISGVVRNAKDEPVTGAIVTLVNKQNSEKQSMVTDKAGKFVFDDCRKNIDYELKAEFQKTRSPARLVSAYNPTGRPFVELRLEEPEKK